MKLSRLAINGALVAVLTACGGQQAAQTTVTAQVPVTVTATPSGDPPDTRSPVSSAAAPSPSPSSASASSAVPVGSSQTYGDITMTVHAINRDAPAETSLDEEQKRTAVDIEACASGPGVKVSGVRWSLQDANGGRYTPPNFTINPVLPEYPTDRGVDVLPGECFRGWLAMDVPPDAELTTVRYEPVDRNNQVAATLFWSIPAA